jgi:hypothetical protein
MDGKDLFSAHSDFITLLRADSSVASLIDTAPGVRAVISRAIKSLYPEANWQFVDAWHFKFLDGFSTLLGSLASTAIRHLYWAIEDVEDGGVQPAALYIGGGISTTVDPLAY